MKNVAIWGAGFIAETHATALNTIGANIVAVVDINAEVAKNFAEKFNIPKFGTDAEILLGDDVETVHVCTPPNLHYEMVKLLLNHGKKVLCEKPLCFETSQAEELMALARAKNLECAVNFNVRYHPACQEMKSKIQNSDFGKIFLVHGSYLQEFHALPAFDGWRYDEKLAGKMRAVTEIGTHWVDLVKFLTDQPMIKISATFGNFQPKRKLENGIMTTNFDTEGEFVTVNSEDVAMIQFMTADGTIGSVVLSEISQGRINRLAVEITGANQSIWWNSEASTVYHTGAKDQGVQSKILPFGENGFTDTFITLIKDFYITKNCVPTFADGLYSAKVCNAIYESATNNGIWKEV